tara:strand:+ start:232 stop:498 length:267 start_codon:yes stop_codon:yes gene_type:complete
MQNALVRQEDCRVHRLLCLATHNQNVSRLPLLIAHSLKANPFGLLQKDAVRRVQVIWPCKVRQNDSLQRKVVTHQREAVKDAVIPLAA